MNTNLTHVDSHFKFGENWRSFVNLISEERIGEAVEGLRRLFPGGELNGKRFLDIGCGSGLSMLAALRLGASHVTGIDIDEASVAVSSALLTKFSPLEQWTVSQMSVFELGFNAPTRYDVTRLPL